MKRCAGITVYAKVENPPGHRIERAFAEGAPLEPGRSYRAAYVTMQAVPARYGRDRRETGVRAVDALRGFMARRGPIDPVPLRAVVAV